MKIFPPKQPPNRIHYDRKTQHDYHIPMEITNCQDKMSTIQTHIHFKYPNHVLDTNMYKAIWFRFRLKAQKLRTIAFSN